MMNMYAKFEVPIFTRYGKTKASADCTREAVQKLLVTTKMTFKLAQGHWYSCHSIGLAFHCSYVRMLHRCRDIIAYLPKFKEVT